MLAKEPRVLQRAALDWKIKVDEIRLLSFKGLGLRALDFRL